MRAIVIAMTAIAMSGCSSSRHSVATSTDEAVNHNVTRYDTLALHYRVEVDSPVVTVEYIDTPRRRVTYSAGRVSVRSDATQVASTAVETTMEAHAKSEESRQPSTGISKWMMILAALGAAATGLWIGRHTS